MNWKDIVKAPPFDVQDRGREVMRDSLNTLEELLEKYLDKKIMSQLTDRPFQLTFTVPVEHNMHQQLVRQAGGEEELKNIIQHMYNIKSVDFKKGAAPHTEGKMAYWIERK
tara:strand:+ start:2714 stop:3046 length:333 start_codon:yes stop_codon:yes gene_type:complete